MNKVEIEVITYKKERLDYFTDLMKKALKKYNRLFKKFKDAPILSAYHEVLCNAGREAQFHGDVVEMLEKDYSKQIENAPDICVGHKAEWISVEERMPEESGLYLIFADSKIQTGNFEKSKGFGVWWNYTPLGTYAYHHRFIEYANLTHWMPLPEPPK